jgi:hypothetical protein
LGCSPIIAPVAPELASVVPGMPLSEQTALRREIAKLVEVQFESGKIHNLVLEDTRIFATTRKLGGGVENPAYCVYAYMIDWVGWRNARTWMVESKILSSGNAYLSVEASGGVAGASIRGCPEKELAEPFPELAEARAARKAGQPWTP